MRVVWIVSHMSMLQGYELEVFTRHTPERLQLRLVLLPVLLSLQGLKNKLRVSRRGVQVAHVRHVLEVKVNAD
jgi:hypothetical protein